MGFKYIFITGPFLAIVFLTFVLQFFLARPLYCWMACLQPEISCMATISYTFGLVPATALSASSAISGCVSSFDMCELSCAKRSNLQPFSTKVNISDTCEIFRNGTKIKPIEIKTKPWLANPFNLDAECQQKGVKSTTTDQPSSTTSSPSQRTPDQNSAPVATNTLNRGSKHPTIVNIPPE